MYLLLGLVAFAKNGVCTIAYKFVHLLFDSDTRNFGLKTTLLATEADFLIVEEWNMSKLASKSVLTIVEFAIAHYTNCHTKTEVEINHIAFGL